MSKTQDPKVTDTAPADGLKDLHEGAISLALCVTQSALEVAEHFGLKDMAKKISEAHKLLDEALDSVYRIAYLAATPREERAAPYLKRNEVAWWEDDQVEAPAIEPGGIAH